MTELVPLKDKIQSIGQLIERYRADIVKMIPKHLTPDRMLQIAITAIRRNPKLADCTPATLIACIMEASALGLEIGGPLGQASLVPYKDACTLIIQYRGKIKLAVQSGEIDAIEARVVHKKDQFEYALGLDPKLVHIPSDEPDPGPPTHFYAVAWTKSGRPMFEVMSKAQVDSHRARSRAKDDGPWVTDYEEMGRKTPTHKLCKYLVLSPENQRAVGLEDQADAGVQQDLRGLELFNQEAPKALEEHTESPKATERPLANVTERLKGGTVQQGKVRQPEQADGPKPEPPKQEQAPPSSEPSPAEQEAIRKAEQAEAAQHQTEQSGTSQTPFSPTTSTAPRQPAPDPPGDLVKEVTRLGKEKGVNMFDLSGFATKQYGHSLIKCSTLELQSILAKLREHPQGERFK